MLRAAGARAPRQEGGQQEQADAQHDAGHRGQVTLPQVDHRLGDGRDRDAARDAQQDAAIRKHAAQADDEGRNAPVRRQVAIQEADHQAAAEYGRQVQRQRPVLRHVQHGGDAAQ